MPDQNKKTVRIHKGLAPHLELIDAKKRNIFSELPRHNRLVIISNLETSRDRRIGIPLTKSGAQRQNVIAVKTLVENSLTGGFKIVGNNFRVPSIFLADVHKHVKSFPLLEVTLHKRFAYTFIIP